MLATGSFAQQVDDQIQCKQIRTGLNCHNLGSVIPRRIAIDLDQLVPSEQRQISRRTHGTCQHRRSGTAATSSTSGAELNTELETGLDAIVKPTGMRSPSDSTGSGEINLSEVASVVIAAGQNLIGRIHETITIEVVNITDRRGREERLGIICVPSSSVALTVAVSVSPVSPIALPK